MSVEAAARVVRIAPADCSGYVSDRQVSAQQQAGHPFDSRSPQIRHRAHPDWGVERPDELRSGQVEFIGERGERPWLGETVAQHMDRRGGNVAPDDASRDADVSQAGRIADTRTGDHRDGFQVVSLSGLRITQMSLMRAPRSANEIAASVCPSASWAMRPGAPLTAISRTVRSGWRR